MDIELRSIYKAYKKQRVYDDFSVVIPGSSVTSLLGSTGCGKTTLLNMIAGIEKPDAGTISGIEHQKISFVFQEPRLLPWLTVRENVEFVLPATLSAYEKKDTAEKYLEYVLLQERLELMPHELSGGMQQKVAIARAFAYSSDIVLMDEPFKGIDVNQKKKLLENFVTLWKAEPRTIVFVTHDVDDALLIGKTLIVIGNKPAQVKKHISISRNQIGIANEDIQEIKLLID